jgi:hypothetical protein
MNQSELLDKILERPALYLGHASVSLMEAFINGHACGREIKNPPIEDPLYYGFHDWVVERFGFGHSHCWSSIISFMGQSEAAAFNLAKELWTEYKEKYEKQDKEITS